MSNYSLNDAPENTKPATTANANYQQYQKPGIYDNVRIIEVRLGKSSLNKIPYLELITAGVNGEQGKSNRMWLSKTIAKDNDGNPKKTSGWGVTQRNLLGLVEATYNMSEDEARKTEFVTGEFADRDAEHEALRAGVEKMLKGRPFRAKFRGEQSQRGTIFAVLDLVESMNVPKESSKLYFNPDRDIKMQPTPADQPVNDLPFN